VQEPPLNVDAAAASRPGPGMKAQRWRSDLWCVAAAVLAWQALSSALDLHESFVVWSLPFERWNFDELPFSAIVLAVGLTWYAWRRRGELQAELGRREAAESHVEVLLARNRQLAQQLISVQEAERQSLARELHDELGQRCSAILLETAHLRRAGDDRAAMRGAAARADVAAQGLYVLLRGMLGRLRPAQLDALGLPAALQELCESWEARSGVACIFHHDGALIGLPDPLNITVYRVVQESLTNVLRHAGATRVRILLVADAGALLLTVQDDGRGMDVAATARRGLGLLGAAERAAAAGGELRVDSAPGAGVRLQLRLPLPLPAVGERWREAA